MRLPTPTGARPSTFVVSVDGLLPGEEDANPGVELVADDATAPYGIIKGHTGSRERLVLSLEKSPVSRQVGSLAFPVPVEVAVGWTN